MGIRVGVRVKVTRRERTPSPPATTPAAKAPLSSEPAWFGFGLGFG